MSGMTKIIRSLLPLGAILEWPDALPPEYLLLYDFQQVSLHDPHSKDLCYDALNQELIMQGGAMATDRFAHGWDKLDYDTAACLDRQGAYRRIALSVQAGDAMVIRTGQGGYVRLRIEHIDHDARFAIAYREYLDPQIHLNAVLTVVLDASATESQADESVLRVMTLRSQMDSDSSD